MNNKNVDVPVFRLGERTNVSRNTNNYNYNYFDSEIIKRLRELPLSHFLVF